MPDQEQQRGSYDDILFAIAGSVISLAIAPFLVTGKFAIIGPIVCILALIIYRSIKRPVPATPAEQKQTLLYHVRRRVQASLKAATQLIDATPSLSERFTLTANKWSGQDASFKSRVVLTKGLIEHFDETGSLLILGDPGIGKTLLLLQLARDLVERNDQTKEPVPIMLSLSSWRDSSDFKQWLITEINTDYLVPLETATSWVKNYSLTLLLDGLDEIPTGHLVSCISALNEYLKSPVPGIVVCSRKVEYESVDINLDLAETISLAPLSDEDINAHLLKAGENSGALQHILSTNDQLRKWAGFPLTLNLFTVVADKIEEVVSKEDQVLQPNDSYLKRVFNLFIRHQLTQKRPRPLPFPPQKILSCLSWLARAKRQTTFFAEQLQPSWLGRLSGRRTQLLVLYTLSSRIAGTAAIMTLGVIMMYVCRGVALVLSSGEGRHIGLIHVEKDLGKWFLITSIFGGLIMFAVDTYRFFTTTDELPKPGTRKNQIGKIAIFIGLCTAVFLFLSYIAGVSNAPYGSLMYGAALGTTLWFRGLTLSPSTDIRIAERMTWSWKNFFKGLPWGALGGVLLGLVGGLLAWWLSGAPTAWHVAALAFVAATLIGGIINGLQKSGEIEISAGGNRIGISAQNALWTSFYVALPFAVIFWIYGMIFTGSLRATLESGLFFGVVVGIIVGFGYGGLDVLYHYVLRPFLWLDGFKVLRYERFLNCATTLNFLRRSEGSYEFFHDLIATHFKTLTQSEIAELTSKRPGPEASLPPASMTSAPAVHSL